MLTHSDLVLDRKKVLKVIIVFSSLNAILFKKKKKSMLVKIKAYLKSWMPISAYSLLHAGKNVFFVNRSKKNCPSKFFLFMSHY